MIRYALIALLLVACSPSKRLDRLVRKHPELRDTVTVVVHDTIVLPGDTVLRSVLLRTTDTVLVTNDRQTVRVVRIPTGSPCDTALFRAEVLASVHPDTVIVTHTVEVPRINTCTGHVEQWWRWLALVTGVALLVLLLFKRT